MSYDLGCFAECLKCELCPKPPPGDDDLELDLPEDYDPWNGGPDDDFWDPPPEEEEGGMWDDFETPGVDLPGGGRATPDWNDGPGIQFEWPF